MSHPCDVGVLGPNAIEFARKAARAGAWASRTCSPVTLAPLCWGERLPGRRGPCGA